MGEGGRRYGEERRRGDRHDLRGEAAGGRGAGGLCVRPAPDGGVAVQWGGAAFRGLSGPGAAGRGVLCRPFWTCADRFLGLLWQEHTGVF